MPRPAPSRKDVFPGGRVVRDFDPGGGTFRTGSLTGGGWDKGDLLVRCFVLHEARTPVPHAVVIEAQFQPYRVFGSGREAGCLARRSGIRNEGQGQPGKQREKGSHGLGKLSDERDVDRVLCKNEVGPGPRRVAAHHRTSLRIQDGLLLTASPPGKPMLSLLAPEMSSRKNT